MSATYIVMQESETPNPPVGDLLENASDGRVLIRLFENASAPEGVSTISRAEAETMLEDTEAWWGPIRPRNL